MVIMATTSDELFAVFKCSHLRRFSYTFKKTCNTLADCNNDNFCQILCNKMAFDIDYPYYPREWHYNEQHTPVYIAFIHNDSAPQPVKDDLTIDMFELSGRSQGANLTVEYSNFPKVVERNNTRKHEEQRRKNTSLPKASCAL